MRVKRLELILEALPNTDRVRMIEDLRGGAGFGPVRMKVWCCCRKSVSSRQTSVMTLSQPITQRVIISRPPSLKTRSSLFDSSCVEA
jgi:hypothetical protein